MQSIGGKARYRNSYQCLVQTARKEGYSGLWRGSTMRLCRLTLSGAVVFTVVSGAGRPIESVLV
jgi:solute carrier family 25 citrate transporter 1